MLVILIALGGSMAKAVLYTRMAMITMVNGGMTRNMELEYTKLTMEMCMKVNSKMVSVVGRVFTNILLELSTLGSLKTIKCMDTVSTPTIVG